MSAAPPATFGRRLGYALWYPFRLFGHASRWVVRLTVVTLVVVSTALGAGVLALRYYVLPNADQHRPWIEARVSDALGKQVGIARIVGEWEGLRPQLRLEGVVLHDRAGRPALELGRVDATLGWLGLTLGELRLHLLEIHEPLLKLRRGPEGALYVAGIELAGTGDEGAAADWLLRQRGIVIRDATVEWNDERRAAPPLRLTGVQFRIDSAGRWHRVGLSAVPPAALAERIELRAELAGRTILQPHEWRGRLYAEVHAVDLAGFRDWVEVAGGPTQGRGAARVWVDLDGGRPAAITADLALAGVRSQLAGNLPELQVESLAGRLRWVRLADGFEFSTEQLGLRQADGVDLAPTNLVLRMTGTAGGVAPFGELRADSVDLVPLRALAERLPLPDAVRARLAALDPSGRIDDLAATWRGDWGALTQYSLRARFTGLSLAQSAPFPGLRGLTGSIDGSERGGRIALESRGAQLEFGELFGQPLRFDSLDAQATWTGHGNKLEVRVARAAFANADVAGTFSGEWRAVPGTLGVIDLSGALSRADLRAAGHYLPLFIDRYTRDWLAGALEAGSVSDGRVRLRGNLSQYPWPADQGGQLNVSARISGGTLYYSTGWPRITGISGELAFRGKQLTMSARTASVMGHPLTRVRAHIPDLYFKDEILEASGEVEAPTADVLRFIATTPVGPMIDRATDGMQAQGRGRLALRLELPLRHLEDTTVQGSYQFLANRLTVDAELPPLEQVNGRLEFTESAVRMAGGSLVVFGQPATVGLESQKDGTIRVALAGRIGADALAQLVNQPWARQLSGATDWRATLRYRRRLGDLLLESSLLGLASALPPPFDKAAGDSVPFRLEQVSGATRDRVSLSYGNVASALLLRRLEPAGPVIERAAIHFGAAAPVPERPGLSVSGTLRQLDLERWRAILAGKTGGAMPALGDVDLRIGVVDALGRRFHDVVFKSGAVSGGLQGRVQARELAGDFNWKPHGRGQLALRMSRLALPAAEPAAAAPAVAALDYVELPALDLTAESFQVGTLALGRLELQAAPAGPHGRDWRIDRLRIVNPDATLAADGVWQSWLRQPSTQLRMQLEVADLGRLLARFGHPEGIRGGGGRIEGMLGWNGPPQRFDVPSLGGHLNFDLDKGQFLKLDPGAARLLGVLSLQMLPRRIALDFRDVFSEGFAFDDIGGVVRLNRGVGVLSDFRIQGPAATVLLNGTVDLAQETQNLRVRVTPVVGDSLAVAGALLGGPVTGLAALALQRLLKDPLAQLIAFEYAVTGSWADPQVTRVPLAATTPPEGPVLQERK
jgi:uncharacterized protein (TIGR02099 family)